MFPLYYFDWTYVFVIAGVVIVMIAQGVMQSTFRKYSQITSQSGKTGEQVARQILDSNGLNDVQIVKVDGSLSDHYDPKRKVVRLSESVFGETSIAAIAVAAHECGHAVQHGRNYLPLSIRSLLVPAVNLSSKLAMPLIIIGLILTTGGISKTLLDIGILLFCVAIVFQLVTLPVEFNASRRALKILKTENILIPAEKSMARKVLTAAALTYVAGLASSLLQLVRLLIFRDRRN